MWNKTFLCKYLLQKNDNVINEIMSFKSSICETTPCFSKRSLQKCWRSFASVRFNNPGSIQLEAPLGLWYIVFNILVFNVIFLF